jgi:16S rRNA (cytosine1402-N4)-methyltransferase
VLREHGIDKGLNAAVLDLGVNSMQVDDPERGFSFSKDGPLDGRYNPQEGTMTMAELVNTASKGELERILRNYADERLARSIARRIVQEREKAPFQRTQRLADLVKNVYPAPQRHGPIHPATRTFQALRIAVNDELGSVQRGTKACMESLAEGGRLAVISFHSGEDRIVKQLFRDASSPRPDPDNPYSATTSEGVMYRQPVRRALKCSPGEAASNPRARSARLRIIERKEARDVA